jgi:hypothetical protein
MKRAFVYRKSAPSVNTPAALRLAKEALRK